MAPSTTKSVVAMSSSETLIAVWEQAADDLAKLAASLGLRAAQADDVLQDVYLAALHSANKSPRTAEDLRLWLFRITVNRCRLEHRRRGRWLRAIGGWLHRSPSRVDVGPGEDLDRELESRLVRRAMLTLDEKWKLPLVLRYFCDFDSRQIGEILGIPDSTVRSRLRTGRHVLAQTLLDAGYTPE
ncbi:MAG: sigma-70 family RNA polymerase sigma factor [Planctomycetes bacterium]|nr:sigma-70 family RNA polymerase sigma factor [Planctomycetota bacterium]